MSVFMSVLVIAYCAVGFFMHLGMKAEYKKDKSKDLDEFSPVFIQMSLFAVSAFWPLLVLVSLYQAFKEKV